MPERHAGCATRDAAQGKYVSKVSWEHTPAGSDTHFIAVWLLYVAPLKYMRLIFPYCSIKLCASACACMGKICVCHRREHVHTFAAMRVCKIVHTCAWRVCSAMLEDQHM